jgi:ABC-type branched-subunit amino acid transport system substrate-binding protein
LPANSPSDDRVLSTRFGRDLHRLFDRLTRAHTWGVTGKAFPVIVLEATDARARAGAYLDALADVARDARIPRAVVVPETDAADAELALLDQISRESAWQEVRPQTGVFRFPRSDLVRSFEDAVRRAGDGEPGRDAAVRAWNETAPLFPWSRRPFKAPVWWPTVGASLAAVFAVLVGALAEGIANKAGAPTLFAAGGALLLATALMAGLMTRRVWLPVLSRIGYGTRYRWFAGSSFFAVLGGTGFYDRLHRVFAQLVTADPTEFVVQTKTFALFEDLHAEHRRLAPSLRGVKRPTAPVVFLNGVTAANGGIDLLAAMSDIRSRRSELHPLLVIASVDHEHRHELDRLIPPDAGGADSVEGRYEDWEARLGTAQGPSQQVALPYLLRLTVPAERPEGKPPPPLRVRRRPHWTWVWSRRSLVVTLVLVLIGGSYLHRRLTSEYCQVDLLFRGNPDTRLRIDSDGSPECVGVATGGLRFERGARSTGMDGNLRPPSRANRGARVTLADLQDRISAENAHVLSIHRPFVTILYTGMLTAAEGGEQSAVSSIRQLAGAYLAQMSNNNSDQPGEVGNPLKIRLLPVNVGQNMDFSVEAADRMLAMARRDSTIVGVVGMERNTESSQAAVTKLNEAGLPVIDTANSSDVLPMLSHYYGIASTDHDEAVAAGNVAGQVFGSRPVRGLVVSRDPGRPRDQYSAELAADVRQELGRYSLSSITYSGADDVAARVRSECAATRYELVYFAGRAEDLPGLLSGLRGGGCTGHPLTLMGGDEVARTAFGGGDHQVIVPDNVTIYYTIFTHLPDLSGTSPFILLNRNLLGVDQPQALLADGQMAVTFDATAALAEAAQEAYSALDLTRGGVEPVPGSRAVTSGSVLLELPALKMRQAVTGTIDFTRDRHTRNGAGNRGLTLVRVTMSGSAPKYEPICGRMNGGHSVPGLKAC